MKTSFFRSGIFKAAIATFLLCGAVLCMALPAQATDTPVIAPVHPSGGERCKAGSACTITWDTRAVQGSVDISLWNADNAQWLPIATNVASPGAFEWIIASTLRGEKFRVKVQSTGNPAQFQFSPTFFYIVESGPEAVSGVEEPVGPGASMNIHPLPASEVAYITCSDTPVKAILRNSLGQEVQVSAAISGAIVTVDTRTMAVGLYIVEVQFRNGTSLYSTFMVGR